MLGRQGRVRLHVGQQEHVCDQRAHHLARLASLPVDRVSVHQPRRTLPGLQFHVRGRQARLGVSSNGLVRVGTTLGGLKHDGASGGADRGGTKIEHRTLSLLCFVVFILLSEVCMNENDDITNKCLLVCLLASEKSKL